MKMYQTFANDHRDESTTGRTCSSRINEKWSRIFQSTRLTTLLIGDSLIWWRDTHAEYLGRF